jgi:enoyl-CoA hydratase/carnithine racemase
VSYDWSLVPAPVVAAIHGNCFGGGLQIALGADIRIASPDAKLSIMEIKWGSFPTWASRRHSRDSYRSTLPRS